MAPKQKRNRRRNINPVKTAINPPAQESLAANQPVNAVQIKSSQPSRQAAAAEVLTPRVNVLNELTRIGIVTGLIIIILILLYIFLK